MSIFKVCDVYSSKQGVMRLLCITIKLAGAGFSRDTTFQSEL